MRSALLVAVVAVLVLQSSSFWKAPPAAVRPGGGWVKLVKEDPSIEANFLSVEDEESLIASKLNEWRELKALGVLDKIDENVSEEDIEEMDILLNRKRRQSVKPVLNPSEKIAFDLQQKLKLVKDNPVALYSILNEMKDKNAHDYSLAKEILLNLARGSNTKLALSSIKLFVSWMEEEKFSEVCKPHELKRFGQHFGLICYTNPAMFSSLNEITSTLVDKGLVDHEESLSIGLVCKDLIDHLEIHNDKVSSLNSQRDEELLTILRPVTNNVKKFSVPELNWIIRVLGKYKQIPEIFDLLKLMRQNRLTPNSESLEFLTNALVVSVDPGTKAVTMKDLPASSTHKPEVSRHS